MICKRINFGDDDDEDDKNTTERKSSEKFSEMEEEITPVNLLSNFNKEKE